MNQKGFISRSLEVYHVLPSHARQDEAFVGEMQETA